jgi:hypothetical protein
MGRLSVDMQEESPMLKKLAAGLLILLTALVIGVGVVAYSYLEAHRSGQRAIQAIPIAQTTASASRLPWRLAASVSTSGVTVTATTPATSTAAKATSATASTSSQQRRTSDDGDCGYREHRLRDRPASSEARFRSMRSERLSFTVNGTTDRVAGQIAFDLSNPSAAQVGTIQINARTSPPIAHGATKRSRIGTQDRCERVHHFVDRARGPADQRHHRPELHLPDRRAI